MLKEPLGKAAKSVASFWGSYGPILKVAAAAVTTAVALTTGLKLDSLLPSSVLDIADGFTTAEGIVQEYCESLSVLTESNKGPWKQVKPSDGLDAIEARAEELKPIARDSYFQFQRFLVSKKFDPTKLLENAKKVPGEDGNVHWEANRGTAGESFEGNDPRGLSPSTSNEDVRGGVSRRRRRRRSIIIGLVVCFFMGLLCRPSPHSRSGKSNNEGKREEKARQGSCIPLVELALLRNAI